MIEINFPNAVRERKDLFGREQELDRALQVLFSGSRRPVVILGERRVGKSSLQNVVAKELQRNPNQRFEPLFPPVADRLADYASEILDTIQNEVEAQGGGGAITMHPVLREGATQARFVSAYRDLFNVMPASTFVLCIDEFDSLLLNCLPEERRQILNFITYLGDKSDLPLLLLLTTSNSYELMGEDLRQFVNRGVSIQLRMLPEESMGVMASTLLTPNWTVDQAALHELYLLSGGHPYFTKLILDCLLRHQSDDSFAITSTDIDQIIPEVVNNITTSLSLANLLAAHFSPEERRAMVWLIQSHGHDPASQAKAHGDAIQNLIHREYVEESVTGGLSFKIGIVDYWLRAHPRELGSEILNSSKVADVPLNSSDVKENNMLLIDARKGRVYAGDREIMLPPLEYQVLLCLGKRLGERVPKDTLAREAWQETEDPKGVSDESIDQVLRRLRKALKEYGIDPSLIETRRGQGYILHQTTYISPSEEDLAE